MNIKYYLGMDIGGTKCAVVLGDDEGHILAKERFETAETPRPYPAMDRMIALGKRLAADKKIEAVGISCGGPLDAVGGIVLCPPNLPGWVNIPAADYFSKAFGVPAYLQNDANACALAEWKYGAAKGCRNAVFLTFGTGMGGGLILNNQLYNGTCSMGAEIGHLRLSTTGPVGFGIAGSFEGWCSGGGLARQGEKLLGYPVTARRLAELARSNEPESETARRIWRRCGKRLGQGLALIIDMVNPECVVIGSIYGRCRDLLEEPMQKELKKLAIPYSRAVCRIVPAGLGEAIGDVASLAAAAYGPVE